jgi:hypothetical protein
VRGGDWVKVDLHAEGKALSFQREAEGLPVHAMAELAGTTSLIGLNHMLRGAMEMPRAQMARSSRRG